VKNQEAIKILKNCYNDDFYYIPQETGVYLIQEYIYELKQVRIEINPPDNMLSLQFYNIMLNKIFEHYLTE
jgi:hypothetical protein